MIYFSLAVHVWFLDKVFYLIPKIVRKEVENGNSSGPSLLKACRLISVSVVNFRLKP